VHRFTKLDRSAVDATHCSFLTGFPLSGSTWPYAHEAVLYALAPMAAIVSWTISNFHERAEGGFSKDTLVPFFALPLGQLARQDHMN